MKNLIKVALLGVIFTIIGCGDDQAGSSAAKSEASMETMSGSSTPQWAELEQNVVTYPE